MYTSIEAIGSIPRISLRLVLLMLALAALSWGCTPEASEQGTKQKSPPVHLVELATVVKRTLRATSTYTGSLRYRTAVRVFNQEEGRLLRLPWYEGDLVASGQNLFEIDTTVLRAELKKSDAVLDEASANFKRTKRLLGRNMISEEEHLRTQTAVAVARAERSVLRARLGFAKASAPFDALVTARLVEPGDVIARHSHLMTIVDPESLVTELGVSELVVPHLAPGTPVEVRIDALGDQSFPGKVLRIHPELNPRTRQGRVEIELQPVPRGARSGQFARVTLRVEALERTVMPFSALRRDRDGEYVFRVSGGETAQRVGIRGGRRLSDQVEVLEGLDNGDRVVVKGFLGLKEGKKVTPVTADTSARTATHG